MAEVIICLMVENVDRLGKDKIYTNLAVINYNFEVVGHQNQKKTILDIVQYNECCVVCNV